jgi:hypothetical protein
VFGAIHTLASYVYMWVMRIYGEQCHRMYTIYSVSSSTTGKQKLKANTICFMYICVRVCVFNLTGGYSMLLPFDPALYYISSRTFKDTLSSS